MRGILRWPILATAMALAACSGGARPATEPPPSAVAAATDLCAVIEPIRARHALPAMAAAVIVDGRVAAVGAVGVRKLGDDTPAAADDRFHLGSCTKAMTATLVQMLVEQGKLAWETTLAQAFPEWAAEMDPAYRDVTLRQVLAHRAGLPSASWPRGQSFADMHGLPGPPREQRAAYVRMMLRQPPEVPPGTKYLYSNAGYAILGHAAERVGGDAWEDLMRRMIFGPLGMTTAGFGAMGTAGRADQPWQHRAGGGSLVPVEPGPRSDNPAVIGPGGTVHASMGDWAKFVAAHLAGARGRPTPLALKDFRPLHEPAFGGEYAGGWLAAERSWGGGRVLTHAGSNTMNFAVVWMAPRRDFAVLVATNAGGEAGPKACDEAAAALIGRFLPPAAGP